MRDVEDTIVVDAPTDVPGARVEKEKVVAAVRLAQPDRLYDRRRMVAQAWALYLHSLTAYL
jgi:hypothetical protein